MLDYQSERHCSKTYEHYSAFVGSLDYQSERHCSKTIENWIDDMSAVHGFAEVAPRVLGWGVRVSQPVCHALEHYRPAAADVLDMDITDYMGRTSHVHTHESIALYPSDRVLGDADKGGNARTIAYMRERYGRVVDTTERVVDVDDGRATYTYIDDEGNEVQW